MLVFIACTTNDTHILTVMDRNERHDLLQLLPPHVERMGRDVRIRTAKRVRRIGQRTKPDMA